MTSFDLGATDGDEQKTLVPVFEIAEVMGRDWIRIGCVCCILLLLVLVLPVSPLLDRTVDGDGRYEHVVDPEGTEAYDDRVEEIAGPNASDAQFRHRTYGNLSSSARDIFDQTLDTKQKPDGAYRMTPKLCTDGAIACPYRDKSDLPPEFSYDPDAPANASAIVVHTDDGAYLYSTGAATWMQTDGGFGQPAGLFGVLLVLPYLVFTSGLLTSMTRRERWIAASVLSAPAALLSVVLGGTILPTLAGLAIGAVLLFAVPLQLLSVPRDPDRWFYVGTLVAGVASILAIVLFPYADVYLWPENVSIGPALVAFAIPWLAGPTLRSLDLLHAAWARFGPRSDSGSE